MATLTEILKILVAAGVGGGFKWLLDHRASRVDAERRAQLESRREANEAEAAERRETIAREREIATAMAQAAGAQTNAAHELQRLADGVTSDLRGLREMVVAGHAATEEHRAHVTRSLDRIEQLITGLLQRPAEHPAHDPAGRSST